jgi:hypothetical protein
MSNQYGQIHQNLFLFPDCFRLRTSPAGADICPCLVSIPSNCKFLQYILSDLQFERTSGEPIVGADLCVCLDKVGEHAGSPLRPVMLKKVPFQILTKK